MKLILIFHIITNLTMYLMICILFLVSSLFAVLQWFMFNNISQYLVQYSHLKKGNGMSLRINLNNKEKHISWFVWAFIRHGPPAAVNLDETVGRHTGTQDIWKSDQCIFSRPLSKRNIPEILPN